MVLWAPVEGETARTLERILATEFVDESEVLRQIADNGPRVRAHLAAIMHYAPRSEEVRGLHLRYVHAWEDLLDSYAAIEKGLDSGDYSKLADGRQGMARWRDAIVGVAHDLRDLRDRTGAEVPAVTPS